MPSGLNPCVVGHNPEPVSAVRGIDGHSRNNKRPAGVTRVFQVRKHLVEPHIDVFSNVLSNDPSGPTLSHDPIHFRPEVTVIVLAAALPGETEWLAGVSPGDDVNRSNCITGQLPHIVVDGDIRPMLPQDRLAELILFTECNRIEPARAFESE